MRLKLDIKEFILKKLFKDGKKITSRLNESWFKNNNYLEYFEKIMNITNFIDFEITFSNRIKYILDDMIIKNHFCECGAILRYSKHCNEYMCSKKCNYFFDKRDKKAKLVKKEKFGNENYNNREKTNITNLERYGGISPMCSEETKLKAKETSYKNFGMNSNAHYSVIAKKKLTKLTKYNDENYNNREKANNTVREKYNVDFISQSPIIKKKKEQTFLKNYGVTNYGKIESIKEKRKLEYLAKIYNFFANNPEYEYNLLFSCDEYIGFKKKEYKFQCKKCNNIFSQKLTNGLASCRCYKCYPKGINHEENQIYDFIKSIYDGKIIKSDKSILNGKELDIYLPDKNIAIEYDGLMFHSFGKDNSSMFNNYTEESNLYKKHLEKTENCLKKDIKLFHIFSNEWNDSLKKDIWRSMLSSHLNKNKKIFARKCEIKIVNSTETNIFLDNNHLQGKVNSSINIGLYYNNILVSIICIGRSRFNKKYDYELLRFCTKKYYNVIGSFSKLMKYFVNNYNFNNLITYADKRYSNGNLYRANNFIELEDSKPNYFYFLSSSKLESRIKYQKHKLKSILQNFNEELTETENMYNNGYRKIYDCGNKVFVLNKTVDRA